MIFKPCGETQFHKKGVCEFCPAQFKLFTNRHHCRKCAKSICSDCTIKRRLSKTDGDLYPCCIECDFAITNSHTDALINEIVSSREDLIKKVEKLLAKAEKGSQLLNEKKDIRKRELEEENEQFKISYDAEQKKISQLEFLAKQIEEDAQIKSNNLQKQKQMLAEASHELQSKKLEIQHLKR